MSATYLQGPVKALKGVEHYHPLFDIYSGWEITKFKACQFLINIYFSIKLLYAHLQYVCNISTKYWERPVRALRGDDVTKYALSNTTFKYVQCSEND